MDTSAALDTIPTVTLPGTAAHLCSAGLLFGVGRRDEDFVAGGITHLLEHLVMHEVGRVPGLDANACVSTSSLEFIATGSPELVGRFLRRVCEVLLDPPIERLAVEARVLRAENGDAGPGPLSDLLGERYGGVDVGMTAFAEPALSAISPERLRDWSHRHIVRGNAAVWSVGELPDGIVADLTRALPDRAAPPRPQLAEARLPLPAWTTQGYDDVVCAAFESAGATTSTAAVVAGHLLRSRVEDELRHGRGLAYDVALDGIRIDDRRRHAGLVVGVAPDRAAEAAGILLAEVRRLADGGPTGTELAHVVEDARAALNDPRQRDEQASAAAEALVRGWTVLDTATLSAQLDALTAAEVRTAAAEIRDTLLLGLPPDVAPDVTPDGLGLPRPPTGSEYQVTGTTYKRRLIGGAPRGARLVVGDEGVTLQLPGDGARTVLWRDVLGLVRQPEGPGRAGRVEAYLLVGADGWEIPFVPADWRSGDEARETILRSVAPLLQVTADPED